MIENMSCQGNTIGGRFSELGSIIAQVKDKARVGVCLDTCHAFAAGTMVWITVHYIAVLQNVDVIVQY